MIEKTAADDAETKAFRARISELEATLQEQADVAAALLEKWQFSEQSNLDLRKERLRLTRNIETLSVENAMLKANKSKPAPPPTK